jgi:ABC-2 type transport system permease protein
MRVFLKAVHTIWLREMIRFFRAKSRVVGSFSMPFFFMTFLGMGLNASFRFSGAGLPEGFSYLHFFVPGIIGMALLFESIQSGMSLLWDRQFGFLKEIMVAPVSRTAIALGKAAGGMTTALIQAMVIIIIAFAFGFRIFSGASGLLFSLLFMILVSGCFVFLGILLASVITDMQGFQMVMRLLTFPLFLLSGAFFPLDRVPGWLRCLSYADPLTYGVDAIRYSLVGISQIPLYVDFLVLLCFGLFTFSLGVRFFRKTEVE